MPDQLTVFYSWQSDSPAELNKDFIEAGLREALRRLPSGATLERALRDAKLELDKDTQGVGGSPPIADTILRKIDKCAVFVADLSLVGECKKALAIESANPRQFPNPNVLVEYGYALHRHSHRRLVAVMNTAYGKPDGESLPFDLRHLLWPSTYHLAHSAAADREQQFEKLVGGLVEKIALILSNEYSPIAPVEKFVPQKPTKSPAVFFEAATDLVGDHSGTFAVPDGGKAYLRLYPSAAVPPINSEYEARELAASGNLRPFGRYETGYAYDRNLFGAIVYEATEGKLFHFSQVFSSREIWGLDARVVNLDELNERRMEFGQPPIAVIPSGYVEEHFVKALANYLEFAQKHLQLPLPLQIEAGLTGIKGYHLAVANGFGGKSLRDVIQWQGEIPSYEKPAWEILGPFFDRMCAHCGVQRTARHQAALAKKFGG